MSETIDLSTLRNGYQPNHRAVLALRKSGLVVVGNELAGSGKDFLIKKIIDLPGSSFGFVPSRKTRKPRDGETLGVDYVRSPLARSVEQVMRGNYIEWEPLRGTEINGTHMAEILAAIKAGIRPIKDVEPAGQVSLRSIDPKLRAIYPLPDLENWLDMLKAREGLPGSNIRAFLGGEFGPADLPEDIEDQNWFEYAEKLAKKKADIVSRLTVAASQWETVWNLGIHKDQNTLFVVNTFGGIDHTAALSHSFLEHGHSLSHSSSQQCMRGEQVLDYLGTASDLAEEALACA